jgi:hypothetical protein
MSTCYDPDRLLADLELTKAKVKKIQMRTLCWDDRDEMTKHLEATPALGEVFINLVRADLEAQL